MVDTERLRRILQRVSADVLALGRYRARGTDVLLADEAALGHVKYLFVTAIEGCINAAQHVCASEGFGPPETNADAVLLLGRHAIVDLVVAEPVAKAVGFRNILVHGYAAVDDVRVTQMLGSLGDLDAFVAELAATL